jgi:hypothetical protein
MSITIGNNNKFNNSDIGDNKITNNVNKENKNIFQKVINVLKLLIGLGE